MQIQESGEMYLESIHVLLKKNGHVRSVDVSEYMGYSKPSVSRAVGLLKNGGYTSKSDSSRHGIGTYSMKQTVESYGAIMKAECTEKVFTLEIMIDKGK